MPTPNIASKREDVITAMGRVIEESRALNEALSIQNDDLKNDLRWIAENTTDPHVKKYIAGALAQHGD